MPACHLAGAGGARRATSLVEILLEGCQLRVVQIAPLYERVPAKLYGGTERVVSYLTEELVRQGHDVTLFASGDSKTSAKLVSCWLAPQSLRQGAVGLSCDHAGEAAAAD
jgi:hypothetical protein